MPANRITNLRLSKITPGQEDILCYTKNKQPKDRIILYESYLIQFRLKHVFFFFKEKDFYWEWLC